MEQCLLSALEKVFPERKRSASCPPLLTAFRGETISFQWALKSEEGFFEGTLAVTSALPVTVRRVESVPVRTPRPEGGYDAGYLRVEPGLYPDLLLPMESDAVLLPERQWRSLWIDADIPCDLPAGEYPVFLKIANFKGETAAETEAKITVLNARLPEQTVMQTEWFHTDCLANFYGVPAWSERHFEIAEAFVRCFVKRGGTMLLTPQFTPPLDTRVGGERTTVQLVDVFADGDGYRFDFSKLRRFVDMALRCGVSQFEMSHLFTQWGAKAAPKIMAARNGKLQRIFGWDTPATGGAYTEFLRAYLPQLTDRLREWGIADRTYFHISDEPSPEQLPGYLAAKASVADLLAGFPIMDAMSDLAIYRQSGIKSPVVDMASLQKFLNDGVPDLWGYYCCGPATVYTNRFIFLPLARTRALGLMIWKYRLRGFLHWGYNFYNTISSLYAVDPHLDTESGGVFPAGDPFVVYPGRDGQPEESVRWMTMQQAMQDVRALSWLEERIGRDRTLALLDQDGEITLTQYPQSAESYNRLRARINRAAAEIAK